MSTDSAYKPSCSTHTYTDRHTQADRQTERQTHGQQTTSSWRRTSQKLRPPRHPPTNHFSDPLQVLAQPDVDPGPVGTAAADPPAHQPGQLVSAVHHAGQRTSRVPLHIRSEVSLSPPGRRYQPLLSPPRWYLAGVCSSRYLPGTEHGGPHPAFVVLVADKAGQYGDVDLMQLVDSIAVWRSTGEQ